MFVEGAASPKEKWSLILWGAGSPSHGEVPPFSACVTEGTETLAARSSVSPPQTANILASSATKGRCVRSSPNGLGRGVSVSRFTEQLTPGGRGGRSEPLPPGGKGAPA